MNNTATTGWIWAGLVGSTGGTILAIFGTFALRGLLVDEPGFDAEHIGLIEV